MYRIVKISYMLKREDFYEINKKTLERFCEKNSKKMDLYVYPELNAIVRKKPSKTVKNYIYTEFKVGGSFIRRCFVFFYTRILLNTNGCFASKKLSLPITLDSDSLIYPCNKKYRIFNFSKNVVRVVPKVGFSTEELEREIAFRKTNHGTFIPSLIEWKKDEYTEKIIDGYPVARSGKRTNELKQRAWGIWQDFIKDTQETIKVSVYVKQLLVQIQQIFKEVKGQNKAVEEKNLNELINKLSNPLLYNEEELVIVLSHGDLQQGNIWVERHTDQIYIIDWESYGQRSGWYDEAVLFKNLRTEKGIREYCLAFDVKHNIVLLEDLIFRLQELKRLPKNYNTANFNEYVLTVLERGLNV